MSLRRRVERLEENGPREPEPWEVVVVQHIIPPGPCGYVVRNPSDEEWSAFAAEHGPEAAARARAYVEAGVCERITERYVDGVLVKEEREG